MIVKIRELRDLKKVRETRRDFSLLHRNHPVRPKHLCPDIRRSEAFTLCYLVAGEAYQGHDAVEGKYGR